MTERREYKMKSVYCYDGKEFESPTCLQKYKIDMVLRHSLPSIIDLEREKISSVISIMLPSLTNIPLAEQRYITYDKREFKTPQEAIDHNAKLLA